MKHTYDDLRSLYRAATREEQPTRTDRRVVRAAIVRAGAAAVALHSSAAAGKLIALIPGGAKVLTIGQVVVYAGLGVSMGAGLAAVGAAVSSKTPVAVSSADAPVLLRPAAARLNAQSAKPTASIEETSELAQPVADEPIADSKPVPNQVTVRDRPAALPSGAFTVERTASAQRTAMPIAPAVTTAAAAPGVLVAPNPAPAAAAPSLVEESRGLAAVQTALGTHDFSRALALLDAQEHDYRGGSLGQERAAARVLALCGAGRTSEAMAARARFVSNYPGSPLIRRTNAACGK